MAPEKGVLGLMRYLALREGMSYQALAPGLPITKTKGEAQSSHQRLPVTNEKDLGGETVLWSLSLSRISLALCHDLCPMSWESQFLGGGHIPVHTRGQDVLPGKGYSPFLA